MAYKLHYSDYPGTDTGPPDPAAWVGPPGPPGPQGATGSITGGTMTEPLNWTSTGSTTSRAAQDRTAESVNVKDFGAAGNGTTNDAAAIQAAATAAAGGILYFPPDATYLIGTPIYLSANTTVMAHGAVIVPSPTIASLPNSSNPALGSGLGPVMFTNVNWQATVLTDQNIHFFGGQLGPLAGPPLGCHGIFLRMVTNTHIADVSTRNLNDGIALLACLNTLIDGCFSQGCGNCAFDHWDGAMNATVRDCEARGTGGGYGVLFNTDSTVTGHSSGVAAHVTIENVRLYNFGGAGIYVGPIVAGLLLTDAHVRGCYIYNCPIGVSYHEVAGGSIVNNVVDTCANPIVVGLQGTSAFPSSNINVTGNTLQNCAISTNYLQVAGPHMLLAGNRAINSTTTSYAIQVDDPTTIVLPNDLPGWSSGYLTNSHPFGGATTPALELDADTTNGRWAFSNNVLFRSGVGFNNTAPIAKPTVSGAKGSNAALASLLTALVAYGLVTDTTTT